MPSLAILSFLLFSFLFSLFMKFLCIPIHLASWLIGMCKFLELVAKVFFVSFNSIFHYFDFLNLLSSFSKEFKFFQIMEFSVLSKEMSCLQKTNAFIIETINFWLNQLNHLLFICFNCQSLAVFSFWIQNFIDFK